VQGRTWIRRCMLVALSTLILAAGAVGDAGEAHAAKKSKKKKNEATVTIVGATTRQTSCEGKLTIDLTYTHNDKKTKVKPIALDKSGEFTVTLEKLGKGWLEVTANVEGHPNQSTLYWDDVTTEIRRNQDQEIDLGRIRIKGCE
jgi:hypothetical protein